MLQEMSLIIAMTKTTVVTQQAYNVHQDSNWKYVTSSKALLRHVAETFSSCAFTLICTLYVTPPTRWYYSLLCCIQQVPVSISSHLIVTSLMISVLVQHYQDCR